MQIALDANLFILLVVGLADRKLIEKHKRTSEFVEADFDQLQKILSRYEQIVVTPHVITEVSNLISQVNEPALSKVRQTLANLLPDSVIEKFEFSIDIVKHRAFVRLGLTDCAILNVIREDIPLLTVDLDLYIEALRKNHNATNFNHLRQAWLLR